MGRKDTSLQEKDFRAQGTPETSSDERGMLMHKDKKSASNPVSATPQGGSVDSGARTVSDDREVKQQEKPTDEHQRPLIAGMTRRTFALGVGGAAVMLGLGGLKFVGTAPIIRPPGGQDEEHLIAACIRCEKCCEICPRGVIAPAHVEDGILNMRTPTFDFQANYCDWCNEENDGHPLCVQVCPTEALRLREEDTDPDVIMGVAVLNKDECLAYRMLSCRFCYDACPYEAMGLDENNRPYMIPEKCNGCGACESVCVSLKNASLSSTATERAIIVRHEHDERVKEQANEI